MKIIDLLNKIANGEENDLQTEFEFDGKIWNFYKLNNSEYCLDGWLLNQNITIIKYKEDLEEKKIPEEIDISNFPKHNNSLKKTAIKVNEVIHYLQYLKSKGE